MVAPGQSSTVWGALLSAGGSPEMIFDSYAGLEDSHALALEEFALQRGVRLADQKFTARADYSVPRDAHT
jgi:hypothetical protein